MKTSATVLVLLALLALVPCVPCAAQTPSAAPVTSVASTADFLATLYRHLGIDAERGTVAEPAGRPVPLLKQGWAPIRELMAGG